MGRRDQLHNQIPVKADVPDSRHHRRIVYIPVQQVGKTVDVVHRHAVVLAMELRNPSAQGTDPLLWVAEAPGVGYVEADAHILPPHLIHKPCQLQWAIQHVIPDIFDHQSHRRRIVGQFRHSLLGGGVGLLVCHILSGHTRDHQSRGRSQHLSCVQHPPDCIHGRLDDLRLPGCQGIDGEADDAAHAA